MNESLKKFLCFILLFFALLGAVDLAWELSWQQGAHLKAEWILDSIGKIHFNKFDSKALQINQKIRPVEGDEKIRVQELLKVNINRAPIDELLEIPRVGPKMAQRIIEARQKWGPFKTIENLKVVKGMGPKTREMLKDWVKFNDGDPPTPRLRRAGDRG